jgi:hypothetical protein
MGAGFKEKKRSKKEVSESGAAVEVPLKKRKNRNLVEQAKVN